MSPIGFFALLELVGLQVIRCQGDNQHIVLVEDCSEGLDSLTASSNDVSHTYARQGMEVYSMVLWHLKRELQLQAHSQWKTPKC